MISSRHLRGYVQLNQHDHVTTSEGYVQLNQHGHATTSEVICGYVLLNQHDFVATSEGYVQLNQHYHVPTSAGIFSQLLSKKPVVIGTLWTSGYYSSALWNRRFLRFLVLVI